MLTEEEILFVTEIRKGKSSFPSFEAHDSDLLTFMEPFPLWSMALPIVSLSTFPSWHHLEVVSMFPKKALELPCLKVPICLQFHWPSPSLHWHNPHPQLHTTKKMLLPFIPNANDPFSDHSLTELSLSSYSLISSPCPPYSLDPLTC